jgi:tetratricopeptide (TPR) repeat protein
MQQDYILRMVQQFSGFLVRVLRLRQEGKTDEAIELLTDAYGSLTGLPASLVHALSEDDLLTLLRAQGRLDPERCLGLAELLREEGHVYDDAGRYEESFPRYLKALRLYLEVADADDERAEERIPGLDDVIEQLSGLDLPAKSAERLVDYLEQTGRYDVAENLVLQRFDAAGDDPRAAAAAIAFYRRLLDRTDAELIVGGLTRDEVADGLARVSGETARGGPAG